MAVLTCLVTDDVTTMGSQNQYRMSKLLHWFSLDNCSGPAYVFWSLDDRLIVSRTVIGTTAKPTKTLSNVALRPDALPLRSRAAVTCSRSHADATHTLATFHTLGCIASRRPVLLFASMCIRTRTDDHPVQRSSS
jgi:hypothetical protein